MDIIQYLSQSNFLLIYISIVILATVALLIYTFFRKEQEFQQQEKKTFADYKKILKNADARERSLVDRAVIVSGNLINRSQQTNEHLESNLDSVLQGIASKEINTLNKESEQTRKDYESYLNTLVTQLHN